MRFQVLDQRRYPLHPHNAKDGGLVCYRWEHRATIGYGAREFLVFLDCFGQKGYIEEVIGGHLERLEDDSLLEALAKFSEEKGFLDIALPPLRKLV